MVVDPLHDAAALLGLVKAQCGYDVPLAAAQYREECLAEAGWPLASRTRSSPSSELTPLEAGAATDFAIGLEAEKFEDRKADKFVGRQNARSDRDRVRA